MLVERKKGTSHVGSSSTYPQTHEQENERERESFLHFPEDWAGGTTEHQELGGNSTQSDGRMSMTAHGCLRAPDLLPVPTWETCGVISRYLTWAKPSECWALWEAINIPEQMCYPQERPLPGAPGHLARCSLVLVTSGSHLQIRCQQVKAAVTGAANFIDRIGFTDYPQNTLKWNIKSAIP